MGAPPPHHHPAQGRVGGALAHGWVTLIELWAVADTFQRCQGPCWLILQPRLCPTAAPVLIAALACRAAAAQVYLVCAGGMLALVRPSQHYRPVGRAADALAHGGWRRAAREGCVLGVRGWAALDMAPHLRMPAPGPQPMYTHPSCNPPSRQVRVPRRAAGAHQLRRIPITGVRRPGGSLVDVCVTVCAIMSHHILGHVYFGGWCPRVPIPGVRGPVGRDTC